MQEKIECAGLDVAQQVKCHGEVINSRYARNEREDVHEAIDLMFEFLGKIKNLHPSAENVALNILRNKY
jgi:hypothetical protein